MWVEFAADGDKVTFRHPIRAVRAAGFRREIQQIIRNDSFQRDDVESFYVYRAAALEDCFRRF